ncbi:MAG: hypothetical protein ACRDZ2_11390 [Ilumatobacteraceae bacterium]
MSDLSPAASRWLAEHHGVITTRELRRAGVGRKTQMRLVANDVLLARHKGVFVATSTPASLAQRCAVLCAAHPSGFVTGPTAGSMVGLRRMPPSASLHFSIRHGARVDAERGVRFRQTTALDAVDRRELPGGIVIASWPRLAFDLGADLRPLDHLSVLHQLLQERRVTSNQLVAIERRLGHPARPGSGTFLRSLNRLAGEPLESHPEVVLAEALRCRNVPVEHQATLAHLADGRTVRIDLAVPSARWGVELDIHPEHLTLDGDARDARRSRQVHLVGWQIEPVTPLDLQDVEHVADELAMLYHARRRAVAS